MEIIIIHESKSEFHTKNILLKMRVCISICKPKAYDEEDPETAKRALSSPFIMHMDVEYARLARDLPLPKGMAALPTKKPAPADNVSCCCCLPIWALL